MEFDKVAEMVADMVVNKVADMERGTRWSTWWTS